MYLAKVLKVNSHNMQMCPDSPGMIILGWSGLLETGIWGAGEQGILGGPGNWNWTYLGQPATWEWGDLAHSEALGYCYPCDPLARVPAFCDGSAAGDSLEPPVAAMLLLALEPLGSGAATAANGNLDSELSNACGSVLAGTRAELPAADLAELAGERDL